MAASHVFTRPQDVLSFLAPLRIAVHVVVIPAQPAPLVLVGLAEPMHDQGYTILHPDGRREYGGTGADLRATLAAQLANTNAIVD